ncbi:hypothetical protein [Guptibacillus sedimenti]|uniref:hypothetical protein n=1 Tax=Guptibacillus sedimenti TaxID=3025680 RepID=UPI00235F9BEE|nr:hypothetical protein [Pseudalkalibacillus sedimenti]
MIFYAFNPEFDNETLESIRSENVIRVGKAPSPHSTIYLFESKDQTVGYVWMESISECMELLEFFYKGSEEKRWGLYDFVVKLAEKQRKKAIRMKTPANEMGEKFLKKWGGMVVERDERGMLIEIPFLCEWE